MSSTEREQRLQFLGLTDRDAESLRALRPVFEANVPAVVDAFYDHLLSFPETAQLLSDHTTVERLKNLQHDYLLRITDGTFDDAYFDDRRRIGKTHERVGLNPHWYLLGYSVYFALLAPLVCRQHGDEAVVALEKAFMLDASLAMDAYIASDRYRHLQQLESIVKDSADVIFSLDQENRFRSWNRAAESIFGWPAKEILGQHFSAIVPPELVQAGELQLIDREIQRHGYFHFESMRLAKDGRRVPVEITVSLLRDPQGSAIGRSAILRDITERKRLQEASLQAERLAVIGAMSAKLAHEIRNPLSSITLNIDLVSDEIEALAKNPGVDSTEARSLLRSIDSEVRRIQRVTEDYLQFARMPKPRRDWIDMNDLLAQGLSFMQSLFAATGVTVRTEFARALPRIYGDDEQLWQAILNIIRNALEAIPGGGTLTLSTNRDGESVMMKIADTGMGMGEDERRLIFKPFFSTKAGGTGLGLPLTQQIVNEHGGHIECVSATGKGTTFIITLPQQTEK